MPDLIVSSPFGWGSECSLWEAVRKAVGQPSCVPKGEIQGVQSNFLFLYKAETWTVYRIRVKKLNA